MAANSDSAFAPDEIGPADSKASALIRNGLLAISAILMALTLYMVFFWVPTELNLGVSQLIFYFHVPLGWLGMLSLVIVAISSLMQLATGSEKWDNLD